MTAASDNKFPKLIVTEGSAPSSPSAGDFKLYVDSGDHLFKMKNSSGTVTTFGQGLADPMTTRGDIIIRNSSNTTARLGRGTSGQVLTSDGTDVAWQDPTGGGGLTSAFLGYNTVGGSTESATFLRVYHKKITTVGACILQNVAIYWKETSDSLQTVRLALFADNSGAAGDLLATTTSPVLAPTNNSSFASNARWMAFPLTYSLAATTDYWIGFMFVNNGSAAVQLYYDAGSDPKWDSGGDFITDGGRYTASSTSRKYSLRALVIS